MPPEVRIRDGIEIELADGTQIVADASNPNGDINILSHAHGDHLYNEPPNELICSEVTAALAAARRDGPGPTVTTDDRIELLDAGHIPGSRAALIHGPDADILYSGDFSTRDRYYLSGFDPVPADVLIIESTYGDPAYVLPPQDEEEAAFRNWLNETMGVPVIAFGYTLGRAQELQHLAAETDRTRVFVTDAIQSINDTLASVLGLEFESELFTEEATLEPGDILVTPSQTNRLSYIDRLVDETGATKVGVSGWAAQSSFKYRGGFDETFALSDHCGFDELLDVVESVDPELVYTNHGFTEELATEITSRFGIQAQALKRNQTTLGDF